MGELETKLSLVELTPRLFNDDFALLKETLSTVAHTESQAMLKGQKGPKTALFAIVSSAVLKTTESDSIEVI